MYNSKQYVTPPHSRPIICKLVASPRRKRENAGALGWGLGRTDFFDICDDVRVS